MKMIWKEKAEPPRGKFLKHQNRFISGEESPISNFSR